MWPFAYWTSEISLSIAATSRVASGLEKPSCSPPSNWRIYQDMTKSESNIGLKIRWWRCLSQFHLPKQRGLLPGPWGSRPGWWDLLWLPRISCHSLTEAELSCFLLTKQFFQASSATFHFAYSFFSVAWVISHQPVNKLLCTDHSSASWYVSPWGPFSPNAVPWLPFITSYPAASQLMFCPDAHCEILVVTPSSMPTTRPPRPNIGLCAGLASLCSNLYASRDFPNSLQLLTVSPLKSVSDFLSYVELNTLPGMTYLPTKQGAREDESVWFIFFTIIIILTFYFILE